MINPASLDERNDALEQKLENSNLPKIVEVLIKDAEKRQRQVVVLSISLLLDLLLTVGLGYLSARTAQLHEKSELNSDAIVRNCETGNDARANNKKLWDYISSAPPTTARTPQQEAQLKDFIAFVNKTFAQRDCDSLIK